MQKISLYNSSEAKILKNFCSLVTKIYNAGSRILVLAASEEEVIELDKNLWSLGRTSFVPHAKQGDENIDKNPVYLSHIYSNPNNADILVIYQNIDQIQHVPQIETNKFKHLIFISSQDDMIGQLKAKINITDQNTSIWREEKSQWNKITL